MLDSIVLLMMALLLRDDPVSSSVRYNREIVRIFERKCVVCHSDGNLSMPLDNYQDVRTWSRAIREEILERRMPPWPAATGVRPLANDMSLTTRELAIVTAWVDGGTPRGDAVDLPPPKQRATWPAGEPDLKLPLPAQSVADDRPYVRRVTVSTRLPAARWLRGFDVAPGERRALRSVFLYLKNPNGQEQWIGGWTPSYAMTSAPASVAYRLPARAVLVAELHYKAWTETGETLADRSTLGLYLQSQPPRFEARTLIVNGEMTLSEDVSIWAVEGNAPDASFEVRAVRPDDVIVPILWVKHNMPDWQLPYVLREPVRLPKGSRIVTRARSAVSIVVF